MPFITKIHKAPLGDFSISFSLKTGKFEITKFPEGLSTERLQHSRMLLDTWDDVNKHLNDIVVNYLHEEKLIRKVIIIQIKTSESLYELSRKERFSDKVEAKKTEDYLHSVEGFHIMWFVAEEYQYSRDIKYKVIEKNKNNTGYRYDRVDIAPQLFSDSYGEVRILDYREDLHIFLKNLDSKISVMVKQISDYFDIEPNKFLQNFESTKLLIN